MQLTNDNYDAIGDTVDGVSASKDKVFINLTNSTLSYSYEWYSLSRGMLSRCYQLTDILGKVILSIVNEDDVIIVITFSDNYSLLIK
jgi:hypothetical protein